MCALYLRQDFSEVFPCQLPRLTGNVQVLWLFSKFGGDVMKTLAVYSSVSIFCSGFVLKDVAIISRSRFGQLHNH